MTHSLAQGFANPSSSHRWGAKARDEVEVGRAQLAELIGANARDLIFTSGATEANNLAIFGVARRSETPIHIISQVTEHSAVLEPLQILSQQGHEVTLLPVSSTGMIDLDQLRAALKPHTRLVSLMYANNETGVKQPIAQIGQLLMNDADPQCLFHVDAAQAIGKFTIDLSQLDIDLLSLSAHKFYGPKGIGALFLRRRNSRRRTLELPPLFFGGSQERGLRPGTTPSHQIVGMGVAALEAMEDLKKGGEQRLCDLREYLLEGLRSIDPHIERRGSPEGAPHVLSVTLSLHVFRQIEERWSHIAYSRGSACHSSSGRPSYVLTAMGLSSEQCSKTLRFGLGRYTTKEEIDHALRLLTPQTQF